MTRRGWRGKWTLGGDRHARCTEYFDLAGVLPTQCHFKFILTHAKPRSFLGKDNPEPGRETFTFAVFRNDTEILLIKAHTQRGCPGNLKASLIV